MRDAIRIGAPLLLLALGIGCNAYPRNQTRFYQADSTHPVGTIECKGDLQLAYVDEVIVDSRDRVTVVNSGKRKCSFRLIDRMGGGRFKTISLNVEAGKRYLCEADLSEALLGINITVVGSGTQLRK